MRGEILACVSSPARTHSATDRLTPCNVATPITPLPALYSRPLETGGACLDVGVIIGVVCVAVYGRSWMVKRSPLVCLLFFARRRNHFTRKTGERKKRRKIADGRNKRGRIKGLRYSSGSTGPSVALCQVCGIPERDVDEDVRFALDARERVRVFGIPQHLRDCPCPLQRAVPDQALGWLETVRNQVYRS